MWGLPLRCQAVSVHKKVCSHSNAHRDHEPSDPKLRETQRIMRSKISAQSSAADHDQRLRPKDSVFQNEDQNSDSIGRAAENDLESVHLVNISHAESCEHGQDHESHATAEVAAINADQ